jgi:beta-N-acetylhexosaminidase
VLALDAGCDLLCIGGGLAGEDIALELRDAIVAAAREGRVSETRLAEAAARVDDLASWRSRQRSHLAADHDVGLIAARRALQVDGSVAIRPDVVVLRFHSTLSQAAGVMPWGLAAPLTQLGARVIPYDVAGGPFDQAEILVSAAQRSLVLVVRNLHRHPEQLSGVESLLARRPDAVVVEMGFPACRPAGSASYIATHGAARVCGLAAAEVLLGR